MVTIEKNICIGCEKCVNDCISQSLYMEEGKSNYKGECLHCGHCVAICPVAAVSIPEYDMQDVEEKDSVERTLQLDTLLSAIKFRRSIRYYQSKRIEAEKLNQIVQAGRYTATAANLQACKFIIVQEQLQQFKDIIWEDLDAAELAGVLPLEAINQMIEMRKESKTDFLFRDAPAVLYIAADNLWDAGLAAQNIELAAIAQGLGVLYNGFLVRCAGVNERAKEFLGNGEKPLAAAMLIGYPRVEYMRTAPRKKADVVWL